jgi:hypothetical protein
MSDREFAFGQYLARTGDYWDLTETARETAQADFNAGWDAANGEAGR